MNIFHKDTSLLIYIFMTYISWFHRTIFLKHRYLRITLYKKKIKKIETNDSKKRWSFLINIFTIRSSSWRVFRDIVINRTACSQCVDTDLRITLYKKKKDREGRSHRWTFHEGTAHPEQNRSHGSRIRLEHHAAPPPIAFPLPFILVIIHWCGNTI